MSYSASSKPLNDTGTVMTPVRTPPLNATRKVTSPAEVPSPASAMLLPLGVCLVMVTVVASAEWSVMVVVAAAPARKPLAATCTEKSSLPSFRLSLATVRVKVWVAALAAVAGKVTVPLRSEAAAKSASTVSPWVTVQVTSVAVPRVAPVRPVRVTV